MVMGWIKTLKIVFRSQQKKMVVFKVDLALMEDFNVLYVIIVKLYRWINLPPVLVILVKLLIVFLV